MDAEQLARQLRKPEGKDGKITGEMMNSSNLQMNRFIFQKALPLSNLKVLEIGFGNGKLIPELLKDSENTFYAGLDYSMDMVNEARAYISNLITSGKAEVLQGEFSKIPFPDNYFDKTISVNTLYFLDNPVECLIEARRVLKPTGKLYLGVRHKEDVKGLEFTKFGFTLYTSEEIEKMLLQAGFENINSSMMEEPPREINGQTIRLRTICIQGEKKS